MTASLADRYVYAVTRALPESQRADIDKELRTPSRMRWMPGSRPARKPPTQSALPSPSSATPPSSRGNTPAARIGWWDPATTRIGSPC